MNFTPSRKTVVSEKHEKSSYDHDLQLYREIPDYNINLDEFEEWAVERLKGKESYCFVRTAVNAANLYFVFSFTNIGTNKFEGKLE